MRHCEVVNGSVLFPYGHWLRADGDRFLDTMPWQGGARWGKQQDMPSGVVEGSFEDEVNKPRMMADIEGGIGKDASLQARVQAEVDDSDKLKEGMDSYGDLGEFSSRKGGKQGCDSHNLSLGDSKTSRVEAPFSKKGAWVLTGKLPPDFSFTSLDFKIQIMDGLKWKTIKF